MLLVYILVSLVLLTTVCGHDSHIPELLRLERTVAILSTKQSVLSTKLKAVESKLKENAEELLKKDKLLLNLTRSVATLQSDVAYEATLSSDLTNFEVGTPLKFSNVKYNRGGSYRASSGIFTAPVSGTYMFWAHIMVNDQNYMGVAFYRNGDQFVKGYTPPGIRYGVASLNIVTSLDKGDQIWVAKYYGSSKVRGSNWSSYGGTLLTAR